jgi:membrane glycosyltransferase
MKVKLQLQGQFGTDEEHLHLQVDGQKNGGSILSSLSIQLLLLLLFLFVWCSNKFTTSLCWWHVLQVPR